jgi:hypothetical protein
MKKEIGIWLNSDKAVLISLKDGQNEQLVTLESNIETRTRIPGERKPFSRLGNILAETSGRLTNRRKQQMHQYFNQIIHSLDQEAGEIYLFGPSTAKIELEKELKKNPTFAHKPVSIESADKMTERQMVARVKSHFVKSNTKNAKPIH